MIITQTPFRMSFFGGGTDMESFFRENGGAVLSTTFDKYCYVNSLKNIFRLIDARSFYNFLRFKEGRNIPTIRHARVAIFEAKYTKVLENLESECDTALQQIDDRMYAKEYEDDYDQILCYGISFFKKRCMVKKK